MKFSKKLISWYKKNKRDLPWRHTNDPYKIWLSEIILQQTRIEQGLSYYIKFVSRFPNVHILAEASEREVLKLWQGLGYYSRARNLHKTAIAIASDFNGQFPDNYNDLLQLSGIGEYTAAAVSSFAYNEPRPVVDGNVLRFLSRINGIITPVDTISGKKMITDIALKQVDRKRPGDFNQAVMEFGALFCTPRNPNCTLCIFRSECKAYLLNKVHSIPVKTKKSTLRKRYFHYFVILYKHQLVYLKKRSGQDIWKNLYDFPLIEKSGKTVQRKMVQELSDYTGINLMDHQQIKISKEYRHILTHQVISARFYTIILNDLKKFKKISSMNGNNLDSVELKKINEYPVPRLIEKFLKNNLFFELL
jgi:A/G-specific adenine glycosylase